MSTCFLGHRYAFSNNYNNYYHKGYDVRALIKRVEELLSVEMPQIIWFPYTSEVAVEHTSLRIARAENPIEEVEACIIRCWEQAALEQDESMSEKHLVRISPLKNMLT